MLDIFRTMTALQIFTVLATWTTAWLLVNLIAHRSQVDGWCEKRPRLAAVLKIMRGFGADPWLIAQGLSLFLKGRLPEKLRVFPILGVVTLLLLTGCAGTFEEARLAGSLNAKGTSAEDRNYCRSLDSQRTTWGAVAKGSALLAGGSGIASLPVDSHDARLALAGGALAAGTTAVVAVYVSESKGEAWVRDCAK